MNKGWKEKYVELYHGKFVYEDFSNNWMMEKSTRKIINLVLNSCRCRPLRNHPTHGRYAFEITELEGPQRIWIASSNDERNMWVEAINTAMTGSSGDFGFDSVSTRTNELLHQNYMFFNKNPFTCTSPMDEGDNSSFGKGIEDDNGALSYPPPPSMTRHKSLLYIYDNNSNHIDKYLNVKQSIQLCSTQYEYISLLSSLNYTRQHPITVYVNSVKVSQSIHTYILYIQLHAAIYFVFLLGSDIENSK
jgi:hypothetical protein